MLIPYSAPIMTATYTASLGTTWTSNTDGYYTQSVAVSGILAADNPIIDLVTTTSGYKEEQEAWGKIFKATTAKESITFYATEATATAINIQIKVVR